MKNKCEYIKKYLNLRGYGVGAKIRYYGMCNIDSKRGINTSYTVKDIMWDNDKPTMVFLNIGHDIESDKGIPIYDIVKNKLNDNVILDISSNTNKVKFSQYDDNVVGVTYNNWHIGEVEIIASRTHITYYKEPLLFLPKYYIDSSEVSNIMEETPENILRKFYLYVNKQNFKLRLNLFEETYELNKGI